MGKDINEMRRERNWVRYAVYVIAGTIICMFRSGYVVYAAETEELLHYSQYLEEHRGEAAVNTIVRLDAESVILDQTSGVQVLDSFQDAGRVLQSNGEDSIIQWNLQIEKEGFYSILFDYCPLESRYAKIEYALYIDDVVPFREAQTMTLTRAWENEREIQSDSRGNHISPMQVPALVFQKSYACDSEGIYNAPLRFYFSKGIHILRMECRRSDFVLRSLILESKAEPPCYQEVASGYNMENTAEEVMLIIEGEDAAFKSDSTIVPIYDRGDPDTSPADPTLLLLNTIGGSKWQEIGQWIVWMMDIPEDGYYKISMRVRQNTVSGRNSYRKIYIDGKVPFCELDTIKFSYGNDWYIKTLGEEEPYLFYLEKGVHEIKMEVVPGELSEIRNELQSVVYELNAIYRQIIMITGTMPDIYRDYRIYDDIPGILDLLAELRGKVYEQKLKMEASSGGSGGSGGLLEALISQLDSFVEKPDTIPLRLDAYKANISSLSAWLLSLTQQPLEVDYLIVASADADVAAGKSGLFERLFFSLRSVLGSFKADYSLVGDFEDSEEALTVWVGMGRDQVQILKELIDNDFVPRTGIKVNVSLVQQGLIEATLAEKGPDIALFVEYTQPVNLAARNALVDLSQLTDYEEVSSRFSEEALVPFSYKGGSYALPCTQSFPMLFYRKDILEELGLEAPKTWDDVYRIAAVLQRNHLTLGIGSDIGTFGTLLYQKGGSFYDEDLLETKLNSESAMSAFAQWTDFFRKYSLPLSYDFQNRFRTGEMPVGVAPYTVYNVLQVTAPEIKGLWEMAIVPGTVKEDGTIDYSVCGSSVDGAVMFEKTKDKEAGWEFLKWFTSARIQGKLGTGLESQMGASARYATANKEALAELPWSREELSLLYEQWGYVREIPQIPASYYITRNINNAFRKVVNDNENSRNTLNQYNYEMNKEVKRKWEEFN